LGHKVHPNGFRLGVVRGWQSRWYAERDYKDILAEDILIRRVIHQELSNASVSKIEIERTAADQVLVKVHTAKPGIVIGKNGDKVDRLRATLEAKTKKRRVRMDIIEIRQPELDATLVGRSIAEQLEKRVSFRRAMKQAVQKSMRANAKGIKVIVGGRLGGAEIARSEKEVEGKVPLQTLRADIDYGQAEAHTTFGVIGIKVWIYRGDILPTRRREPGEAPAEAVVPTPQREERRGGERGERRQRGDRSQGERRGGERGQGERGQRPPRGDRQQGERPQGERGQRPPRGEQRPQGERPQGERGPRPPRGEQRSQGERPQGERPQGERGPRPPRGEQRSQGERPQGERPQGERGPRPPRQPRPQNPVSSEGSAAKTQPAAPAPQAPAPESGSGSERGTTGTTQSE
jgi:small subunit ribosomal protein S3